jgi:hypothetical protein
VNEIEVSPHDPATVWVAFRRDRRGDPTPLIYRSSDYGKSWTLLVDGLRAGEPVRVVREDPMRRGLVFAGTETGAWVSVDNGARWQPMPGMPVVPITDLEVRHGDLIASTEGRAFWILDDLSALRQMTPEIARAGVHLFAPRNTTLADFGGGWGGGSASSVGRNPATGATIHYRLGAAPDSSTTLSLAFVDARGTVLRTYSNKSPAGPARLAPKAGLNAFTWDLRRDAPTSLQGVVLFGAPSGGGAKVPPGRYTVKLTVGDVTQSASFDVAQDPRLDPIAATVIAERDSLANLLSQRIAEINDAVLRVRDVKTQVTGIVSRTKEIPLADSITSAGRALTARADKLDPAMTTKAGNGQDIINYANGINGQFGFLLGQIEGHPGLTQPARERLAELEKLWAALKADVTTFETVEVEAFNELLKRAGIGGVLTPTKKPKMVM